MFWGATKDNHIRQWTKPINVVCVLTALPTYSIVPRSPSSSGLLIPRDTIVLKLGHLVTLQWPLSVQVKGVSNGCGKLHCCLILINCHSHPSNHHPDPSTAINTELRPSTSKKIMALSWRLRWWLACFNNEVIFFLSFFFFFFFFFFFWLGYEGSPARGWIITGTAPLPPTPGNVGEPHLNLHHSSRHCKIPNPLSEARDRTHILMDPSRVH